MNGAQKLHAKPVPRVGGLGLIVGLLMAGLAGYVSHGNSYPTTLTLLVCALPVFLAGFVEDLTKRVSVRTRLLSSFVSAALAVWLLGAQLTDVDVPGLDALMRFSIVGVLFTVFAVGGVTHSVNIIDGLNGLAGGAVCIMLAGLASLSWIYGDSVVMPGLGVNQVPGSGVWRGAWLHDVARGGAVTDTNLRLPPSTRQLQP